MGLIVSRIIVGIATLCFAAGWVKGIAHFDAYFGISAFVFAGLFYDYRGIKKSLTPHDEQLFQKFRALFADHGYIRAYREHHFLSMFPRVYVTPLFEVVETWSDAAHTFSNKALEGKKIEFVKAANDLGVKISQYTTPTDSNSHVTVLPRNTDPENPPDWIRQEAEEINASVPLFVKTHEDLLKLGNRLGARPVQSIGHKK